MSMDEIGILQGDLTPNRKNPLDTEAIHSVLSNQRRRLALETLREADGPLDLRDLSEQIAAAETGESPPPRNKRQSVYVSLHQTHMPKLKDLGIVSYDEQSKFVSLEEPMSDVAVYMETVPRFGLSWSEFYTGVGLLGVLTLVSVAIGVPGFSAISPLYWAIGYLSLVLFAGIFQTIQQGSSIFHRINGYWGGK